MYLDLLKQLYGNTQDKIDRLLTDKAESNNYIILYQYITKYE